MTGGILIGFGILGIYAATLEGRRTNFREAYLVSPAKKPEVVADRILGIVEATLQLCSSCHQLAPGKEIWFWIGELESAGKQFEGSSQGLTGTTYSYLATESFRNVEKLGGKWICSECEERYTHESAIADRVRRGSSRSAIRVWSDDEYREMKRKANELRDDTSRCSKCGKLLGEYEGKDPGHMCSKCRPTFLKH